MDPRLGSNGKNVVFMGRVEVLIDGGHGFLHGGPGENYP